jgi:hypothetical protein
VTTCHFSEHTNVGDLNTYVISTEENQGKVRTGNYRQRKFLMGLGKEFV